MTTIAYRDGCIAADGGVMQGHVLCGTMRKVARNGAGDLCGACGDSVYVAAVLAWFEGGEQGDAPQGNQEEGAGDCAFIARRGGPLVMLEACGGRFEMEHTTYACGSGGDLALGAMLTGATPVQAIEIAVARDAYSAPPIFVLYAEG